MKINIILGSEIKNENQENVAPNFDFQQFFLKSYYQPQPHFSATDPVHVEQYYRDDLENERIGGTHRLAQHNQINIFDTNPVIGEDDEDLNERVPLEEIISPRNLEALARPILNPVPNNSKVPLD